MNDPYTLSKWTASPKVIAVLLTLVFASCGGTEVVDTTSATTTTTAVTTTVTTMQLTTTTAAPATTAPAASDDLPTSLKGGTYLVGSEIRAGAWVGDMCGCSWAYVDEAGNEERGTSEDADVRATDYAIWLAPCTWTFFG